MNPWSTIASQAKAPEGVVITCDSGETVNPPKLGGGIHQFGEHMGSVSSSAVTLLHTKGVLWAEMGLIFWKPLSSALGTPVAGEMKDASRDKAE